MYFKTTFSCMQFKKKIVFHCQTRFSKIFLFKPKKNPFNHFHRKISSDKFNQKTHKFPTKFAYVLNEKFVCNVKCLVHVIARSFIYFSFFNKIYFRLFCNLQKGKKSDSLKFSGLEKFQVAKKRTFYVWNKRKKICSKEKSEMKNLCYGIKKRSCVKLL